MRLPRQTVRITKSAGEDAMGTGCAINLPNGSAIQLRANTVFSDITVRTDTGVQLGAVFAGNEAFSPVVIDRAAWQGGQNSAGLSDNCFPERIVEAKDSIRISDIKVVTNQSYAKRRVEVIDENGAEVIVAITMRVAK